MVYQSRYYIEGYKLLSITTKLMYLSGKGKQTTSKVTTTSTQPMWRL